MLLLHLLPEFRFGSWQHSPLLTGSELHHSLPCPISPRHACPGSVVFRASPVGAQALLGRGSSVGVRERAPSQCASAIVLTQRHMAPSETAKRNPTADAAKAESWQQTARPVKCLLCHRRVVGQHSTILLGLALCIPLRHGAD